MRVLVSFGRLLLASPFLAAWLVLSIVGLHRTAARAEAWAEIIIDNYDL